ncbi:MAG: hypothetical protein DRJ98_08805 [Thermoprotei archaeon]|nr:MAG: hypothetical protein DRJ98_08805 [Thermoprotei archaeon]RLG93628.1 MAG: hypothetical protein DRO29_07480 [Candidatus Bathyarchaeota archaeon]
MVESEKESGDKRRKRRQVCITLPCELVDELSDVCSTLGLDLSRGVELCMRYGDSGFALLKKTAQRLKELEEERVFGVVEGGESQEEEEEEGGDE